MKLEAARCGICSSDEAAATFEMNDFLYGVPGTFRLVRCARCGLLYLSPRPDAETLVGLYRQYYRRGAAVRESGLITALRRIPQVRRMYNAVTGEFAAGIIHRAKGKTLDIGCGAGAMLEDLRRAGCDACGIELNPDEAALAREKGFTVHCGSLDDARFPGGTFDTVVMNHVLEHIASPAATLAEIRRILKPGGAVMIQSPNSGSYMRCLFGPYWAGWHLPFHFLHLTPATARVLFETCGLRVRRIKTATPEHYFLVSLAAALRHHRCPRLAAFVRGRFIRSLPARLLYSCLFRLADLFLPHRGEILYVAAVKEGADAER